ncbi:hypothetical protein [Nesterenkonia sp. HG001]|uniref:hypothetical protein n=1 Tax=Nesterenkonia sp. HG001 TaxID=2983207 RepID=UPI002AC60046|nr:hypothetical protein [Nesterenkonia sp. HG001]MDZ5078485.1 hypothetical protein [Nesterenkonia sp. HG001]
MALWHFGTSALRHFGTSALVVAMGLQYVGIAGSITNFAFGAVVVGGALATALAFGLGGGIPQPAR